MKPVVIIGPAGSGKSFLIERLKGHFPKLSYLDDLSSHYGNSAVPIPLSSLQVIAVKDSTELTNAFPKTDLSEFRIFHLMAYNRDALYHNVLAALSQESAPQTSVKACDCGASKTFGVSDPDPIYHYCWCSLMKQEASKR